MPTISPHAIAGDFNQAVFDFLKMQETFVPRVYSDSKGIPTLGVGYALIVEQDGVFQRRDTLSTDLALAGTTLTKADNDLLADIEDALNAGNVTRAKSLVPPFRVGENSAAQNRFSFPLITEAQFQPLFTQLIDEATTTLRSRIGQEVFSPLAGSNEMVALLSLTFNNPSLIGSNLIAALQNGDRAEAWYQIRYQSNREQSDGIANRRYAESDLFGLYNSGDGSAATATPDTPEAKQVLAMYTAHRQDIERYEGQFSPFAPQAPQHGIDFALAPARTHLVDTFATPLGVTISGNVLVGQDDLGRGDILTGTSEGDLLFGEAGSDVLRGDGGADVLYGGAGSDTLSGGTENDVLVGEAGDDTLQGGEGADHLVGGEQDDTLVGGTGDDLLEGGAGFDRYVWNTGDGNDRIEDSDNRGNIVINGQALTGSSAITRAETCAVQMPAS